MLILNCLFHNSSKKSKENKFVNLHVVQFSHLLGYHESLIYPAEMKNVRLVSLLAGKDRLNSSQNIIGDLRMLHLVPVQNMNFHKEIPSSTS
jgi:hypothetical protein